MSANGLCKHNNFMGYCPSCLKEQSMRGMGRLNGNMGADCPTGFYRLKVFGVDTGQCLPELDTAISAAEGGVTGSVAKGAVASSANVAAAQSAAASALGTKIMNFYKTQPGLAWGLTAGVALLFVYGGMSFIRGK